MGVRRADERALRDFALRFRPLLLDQARRIGVERAERENVVMAFLDDIALRLAGTRAPRCIATFIVKSFRNHLADVRRAESVRLQHEEGECEDTGGERAVRVSCSQFTLRAVLGPDAEEQDSAAASALVSTMLSGCSADERRLLVWSSHRVPLREIASWLDISYDAAKARVSRLRIRLVRDVAAQLSNLDPSDRAAMTRLLRRAGVSVDDERAGGAAA